MNVEFDGVKDRLRVHDRRGVDGDTPAMSALERVAPDQGAGSEPADGHIMVHVRLTVEQVGALMTLGVLRYLPWPCVECDELFVPSRTDQRFCSVRCRSRAKKRAQRARLSPDAMSALSVDGK